MAFGVHRRRRLWAVVVWGIGISLWAQWLGPGTWAELQSEDGSEAALMLQALPFAALAVATTWDRAVGRMALVPASFLPGLAMLPTAEWEALTSPLALGLSLATFALYLVVASRYPKSTSDWRKDRRATRGLPDRFAGRFWRFVIARMVVMGAVFGMITYALFFEPSGVEALQSVEDERTRRVQHAFAAVLGYFAWLVAMYIGALLPALNWEHYRRRSAVPVRLRNLLHSPDRLRWRVAAWIVVLMVVTFGLMWMWS